MDWFRSEVEKYMENEVKMQKLKRGSKGIDVAVFQSIMKKLGYYKGEIDESFGKLSEEACKAFQEDYPECGINGKPDGSFGPKCWGKVFALVGA